MIGSLCNKRVSFHIKVPIQNIRALCEVYINIVSQINANKRVYKAYIY